MLGPVIIEQQHLNALHLLKLFVVTLPRLRREGRPQVIQQIWHRLQQDRITSLYTLFCDGNR